MNDGTSDADGEMIALTIDCLLKSGLKEFKVDIGHAGLFRGLVEEAGLSEEEQQQLKVYLANKNIFAVESLLEEKEIPAGARNCLQAWPIYLAGLKRF